MFDAQALVARQNGAAGDRLNVRQLLLRAGNADARTHTRAQRGGGATGSLAPIYLHSKQQLVEIFDLVGGVARHVIERGALGRAEQRAPKHRHAHALAVAVDDFVADALEHEAVQLVCTNERERRTNDERTKNAKQRRR